MVLSILLVVTGLQTGAGESAMASAATCKSWTGNQPLDPGTNLNSLHGVAVLSACDAWAVGVERGSDGKAKTLIEHWNGSSWKLVVSPSPGGDHGLLASVRGTSPTNIWAVGTSISGTVPNALIFHWNGHVWKQVSSPDPGSAFSELRGVRAVSATDAWAVGDDGSSTVVLHNLIMHWNGHAWRKVSIPDLGPESVLTGVAATSGSDVWAVGDSVTNSTANTVILHWNGRKWRHVASPDPGSFNELDAVAATSPTNAWAVGDSSESKSPSHTLVLHWNGHKWSHVASPNAGGPAAGNVLNGVTATSAKNAWTVGSFGNSNLILRWNGARWARVPSPDIGRDELLAVAAGSASNAWAVGDFSDMGMNGALAVHCC
jgi:hypothetical protein